eukprot:CAMPEP_0172038660 /NCGR_PEP_ID=MMETSP1041-20130122/23446_1 /TAXON_ID=464988 /ORGANISM="Hemiselmis andersenii, Strain CCMP439" /LENGTH=175 /DNA_ID=CAMNT_0012696231 /DNA_START=18 /DNA_END=542 /DNA_ORIENTATION=-
MTLFILSILLLALSLTRRSLSAWSLAPTPTKLLSARSSIKVSFTSPWENSAALGRGLPQIPCGGAEQPIVAPVGLRAWPFLVLLQVDLHLAHGVRLLHALAPVPHRDDEVGVACRVFYRQDEGIAIAVCRPVGARIVVDHPRHRRLGPDGPVVGVEHAEDVPACAVRPHIEPAPR